MPNTMSFKDLKLREEAIGRLQNMFRGATFVDVIDDGWGESWIAEFNVNGKKPALDYVLLERLGSGDGDGVEVKVFSTDVFE